MEQARAATEAQREQLEQLRLNATLEIKRADLALRRSAEKVDLAHTGVNQAEENLRITTERYRAGLATSTETLDANVALLQAKVALTGSRVEREIAGVRLARAEGRLP